MNRNTQILRISIIDRYHHLISIPVITPGTQAQSDKSMIRNYFIFPNGFCISTMDEKMEAMVIEKLNDFRLYISDLKFLNDDFHLEVISPDGIKKLLSDWQPILKKFPIWNEFELYFSTIESNSVDYDLSHLDNFTRANSNIIIHDDDDQN